jgi:hypothetical protein
MSFQPFERRPENIALTPLQQQHVLDEVGRRHSHCHSCGGDDFRVGDALYVGFLFHNEKTDAYMVALTCTNPECVVPHTGINMPESQFLSP